LQGWKDCRYELFPIASIDEFSALLKQHPDLQGINVTIPYKKGIVAFLDSTIHLPQGLAACNCIRIRDGKTEGFNTDVIGFEQSLFPLLNPRHKKALVLGNGGATAAVVFVLNKLGIGYGIVSREKKQGSQYEYSELNEDILASHTLIINSTPLGLFPSVDTFPAIPYRYLGKDHLLYDLVYNPAESLFLKKGKEQGASIKNGEEMLIIQAEESWRIWNEI
jgi:shikimate dehydrogenase